MWGYTNGCHNKIYSVSIGKHIKNMDKLSDQLISPSALGEIFSNLLTLIEKYEDSILIYCFKNWIFYRG